MRKHDIGEGLSAYHLFDKDGQAVSSYIYDAYLEALYHEGIRSTLTYSGQLYDEDTGRYVTPARIYDPVSGRFLQVDTYAGELLDPLSLNRYAYCLGNPVMFIDPTGHVAEDDFNEGILDKLSQIVTGSFVGRIGTFLKNVYNNGWDTAFESAKNAVITSINRIDKKLGLAGRVILSVALIAIGAGITICSGGALTPMGVFLAGLAGGCLSAGVATALLTYQDIRQNGCITVSASQFIKTALMAGGTGAVAGSLAFVAGGLASAASGAAAVKSAGTAAVYATKYGVNFAANTAGNMLVQRVTTGKIDLGEAMKGAAIDTLFLASFDAAKNWKSVKGAIASTAQTVKQKVSNAVASVKGKIGALVQKVRGFASKVGEKLGYRQFWQNELGAVDLSWFDKKLKNSGNSYHLDINGRWHRPNGQFASNAEVGIKPTLKKTSELHGNALTDSRTNYGYALVDKDTNEILKFGETLSPNSRYSHGYLNENNAKMVILEQGSKRDVHLWQHDMNEYYLYKYNEYPPLNRRGW